MSDLQNALDAFDKENYERAIALLRPLAETGNSEAECLMGNMYQLGLGVEKSISAAINWYVKASEKGHAIAANNLGGIYLVGDGDVPPNEILAQKWYGRARELGFDHSPLEAKKPNLSLRGR